MEFTYEEAVAYLYDTPKFTTKNGLEHTEELVRRLGVDSKQFKIIHVAGSNGKGSVCSAINEVLIRGNKRTGMFISPHLVNMEERFCVDGRPCKRGQFLEAFREVYHRVEQMQEEGLAHPTFFEYLFAMGMWIFSREQVEYLILETGLGGRKDCTNIVEHPLITVITSISLEHTEYLGTTIAEIAGEKAGIIKEGVPVVYDASSQEAAKVIGERAYEKNAKTYGILPKSLKFPKFNGKNIDFYYGSDYDVDTRISIPFAAPYQMMNMALVYQTMMLLEKDTGIPKEEILKGIAHTRWQGRMQELEENIYLDGAHNVAGVKSFLEAVRWIQPHHPVLLFSMVRDKDYGEAIRLLAQEDWERIYVTQVRDERGVSARELAEVFQSSGKEAVVIADCKEAFLTAREERNQKQTLFCTGSLYFVGELLSLTGGNEDD